ncbi:MAG TPA: energy transducer TonB [Polaromonas sp.]|nr:energy transducer TonB [Polaromonas sp. UBA4122]HAL38239.1 energy transducer TonB [Polaromonas sp.]
MNATAFSSTAAPPADMAPLPLPLPLSRNAMIALVVVALHVGFIWVLQSGLLMHSAELVVPAEVLSQFVDPPTPKLAPVPPVPIQPTPMAQKKTVPKAPVQSLQPQALPLAIADPTPSLDAPTDIVTPPLPPAPAPAPVAAATDAPVASPALVTFQLPSNSADYLQNQKPPYPPLSARLGETGKVVYKVWIGPDGKAQRAELVRSSGFSRLDNAAFETVMRWRYVPGKRNGVPETMPFNVPISWELRQ